MYFDGAKIKNLLISSASLTICKQLVLKLLR